MRVSRARVVVLVCVSNVTVATVSTVLYYRELFILAAAPQFTMQINAAIQCTISGAGLVCLDLSGLAPRRRQAPVRMRVWLGLAALFVLQNTLEISAIDGLGPDNGSLTTVIQQAVIPITLLISASLLGKSYGRLHWIAAAAVTAGVVASQRFGGPITTSLQWGWAWALLVSRVPAAAANVLSEAVLAPPGPTPRAWPQLRSVLRATFWTGLFALPLNLPSNLAVSALRGLPPLHAVRDDYSAGALCLLRETGCSGAAAAVLAFAVPGAPPPPSPNAASLPRPCLSLSRHAARRAAQGPSSPPSSLQPCSRRARRCTFSSPRCSFRSWRRRCPRPP